MNDCSSWIIKKTSSFLRCSTPSTRRGTREGMLLITPWALPSLWCAFGWLRLADRTLFQEVEIQFPLLLLAIDHHHPATPLFLMSFVWTTAHPCAFSANPELLTGVHATTMHCCCFSRYQIWRKKERYSFCFLSFDILSCSPGGMKRGTWHRSEIQRKPTMKSTSMTGLETRQEWWQFGANWRRSSERPTKTFNCSLFAQYVTIQYQAIIDCRAYNYSWQ